MKLYSKTIIKKLFEPSTFKLGIILTFLLSFVFNNFYQIPPEEIKNHPFYSIIQLIHQKTVDLRLKARGPLEVSNKIALVTVDEKSLEQIGRWPWPRYKIAEIIETLIKYKAKLIAFDAVFSEPEENSALKILNKIKNNTKLPQATLNKINNEIKNSDNDKILANAVSTHSDHLVMGAYFDENKIINRFYQFCIQYIEQQSPEFSLLSKDEAPLIVLDENLIEVPLQIENFFRNFTAQNKPPPNLEKLEARDFVTQAQDKFCSTWPDKLKNIWVQIQNADSSLKNISFEDWFAEFQSKLYLNPVTKAERYWLNIPAIADKTKFTGYFNAFLDSDGTIRYSNLLAQFGDSYYPSLALKSAMVYLNNSVMIHMNLDPTKPYMKRIKDIQLTNPETGEVIQSIPVDSTGKLMINYAGPRHSFPYLSVAELLSPSETIKVTFHDQDYVYKKSEFIKDKIFFFGATAIGIFDLRVTPFDENFPGLETHANITENILQQNYLKTSDLERIYLPEAILVLGFLFSFLIAELGAIWGFLTAFFSLVTLYFFDMKFLFSNGTVVTIIFPIFLIIILYVFMTFYKYLTEERKKQELKGTFQKYVSPAIVNEILANPQNIELGGKKQRMTVLFSDVRGFTTISEKLDPRVLSQVLNEYLTPMTRLVFESKGTLDKYMGDAIMAFFGAPIPYPDHAKYACLCALKMIEQLKVIQSEYEKKNYPKIDIGIGINTGDMSVGNMGSDIVRSYTVMGDAVNLGSRLEGITKQYGSKIIISEFTYNDIKNDFTCREIDWVRVKGKLQPVKIYELLSKEPIPLQNQEMLKYFTEGTQHYHQKQWEKAIESFNLSLNLVPSDPASQLYLKRCQNYLQTPPEDDWDGVFEMKTK